MTKRATSPFAAMSMAGLSAVFDTAIAAQDAVLSIYNQPRTDDDRLAHRWIDEEANRTSLLEQEIAAEAERRTPTNGHDIRTRAEILIRWGLECGSWLDILTAAHIEPAPKGPTGLDVLHVV